MPNSEAAQSKHTAVELIKKFQQLFTNLNHKQIAERLVKLVIAKQTIQRVALLIVRDGHIYVEALAHRPHAPNTEPSINAIATALSRINNLPTAHIQDVFESGQPLALNRSAMSSLIGKTLPIDTCSCFLHPICENQKTIAVFYMESRDELTDLQQAVQQLDTVWTFSSLLVRQVIDMWQHEEQDHKKRGSYALQH